MKVAVKPIVVETVFINLGKKLGEQDIREKIELI